MTSTTISQFVCTSEKLKFKEVPKEVNKLGPHELLIKTLACGVCHTDCSYFGEGLVLGHEPIGKVIACGSEVNSRIKVGDVVGTSYLRSACLECNECMSGQDAMCINRKMFPEGNMNGFASHQVADSRFTYKIPEGMEPKDASVLMCAGVTVFQALYQSGVKPTGSVAITGLGGLGHLAAQFCRAWGVRTGVISRTADKKQEALGFGAHEFIVSKDLTPEYIEKMKKFDVILDTVSASIDWDLYLSLLKRNGTLYMIGLPDKPIEIKDTVGLLVEQKAIRGSIVGGRNSIELMLEFAQRHNIKAQLEEYPFDIQNLEKAMQRCEEGKARYRGVLIAKD